MHRFTKWIGAQARHCSSDLLKCYSYCPGYALIWRYNWRSIEFKDAAHSLFKEMGCELTQFLLITKNNFEESNQEMLLVLHVSANENLIIGIKLSDDREFVFNLVSSSPGWVRHDLLMIWNNGEKSLCYRLMLWIGVHNCAQPKLHEVVFQLIFSPNTAR